MNANLLQHLHHLLKVISHLHKCVKTPDVGLAESFCVFVPYLFWQTSTWSRSWVMWLCRQLCAAPRVTMPAALSRSSEPSSSQSTTTPSPTWSHDWWRWSENMEMRCRWETAKVRDCWFGDSRGEKYFSTAHLFFTLQKRMYVKADFCALWIKPHVFQGYVMEVLLTLESVVVNLAECLKNSDLMAALTRYASAISKN